MRRFIETLTVLLLVVLPGIATATQVKNDFFSPTGGSLENTLLAIPSCNMEPYGKPTVADLATAFAKAKEYEDEGKAFLKSIGLYDCANHPDHLVCKLLTDRDANYESLGLIEEFQQSGMEGKMRTAISYFAYLVSQGYNTDTARSNLFDTLRDLVSIYMVFADEFLIDALDFRFSTDINMDAYLDEQIKQLEKAAYWYETGSQTFMSVWLQPIVSSNQIIGQLFEQNEWDLFNLLYQRLSMAFREKGVRDRVRMVKSTDTVRAELSQAAMELFVQANAMSKTLGNKFSSYGGDTVMTALNLIQKQLTDLNHNLNPLGYDERYVPLNDFDSLYGLADNACKVALDRESTVKQDNRDYDSILERAQEQQNTLDTTYVGQLAELTGCQANLPPDQFTFCVECSGGDLYDCRMDLDPNAFETCVKSKVAGAGILGAKYRQIKDSDMSLKRAQLQYDNINKKIQYENERVDYVIQVWKDYTGAQKEALDKYQEKMKGACTVTETVKYETTKDRRTGATTRKERTKSTEKSFTLRDDALNLQMDKERDLYDATLNFEIKMAQDDTAIKNLLLEQADTLIGIDMAVHNKNTMIAAFDAVMRQKENSLTLWQRNRQFIEKYWSQRLPIYRIIQSDAILQLSSKLNELAHYTYLATKALEYKYMHVMQGVPVGSLGTLNCTDIFKFQRATDFTDYLGKLQAYNVLECPAGSFQEHPYRISLAIDVLGLTGSDADENYRRFQEFVNQNIDKDENLTFTFTTSVYDNVLRQYQKANLKIWQGPMPCSHTTTPKGLTASLFFTGAPGAIFPVIYVAQKGDQPFLRKNGETATYYPVKALALMNMNDKAPEPFTKDLFTAFHDIDPRFATSSMGEWTPAFTNRGVAATQWQVTLYLQPAETGFAPVPFNKLNDICLYFDTIGNNFD